MHNSSATNKSSSARLDSIAEAFATFDTQQTGKALYTDIVNRFDASKHPEVHEGFMAPSKALQILHTHFEPCAREHDGYITWDEFYTFHAKMSKEIDKRRVADHDGFFVALITQLWRLKVNELLVTKIIPVSLDKPSGLSATRGLDFIWLDNDGKFVGYKGVIAPSFARSSLPEGLRGFFALPQELEQKIITYLPIQSAAQPPFDLVWRESEDQPYVGFQGIIAANIDLECVPESLRQYIATNRTSIAQGVKFFPTQKASNPFYKKSSQSIGVGAYEHALRVNDLKKELHQGGACGTVFAGRSGNFTSQFAGGMPVTSGFNV